MGLLPDRGMDDNTPPEISVQLKVQPNKTYKMHVDDDRIAGHITEAKAAIEQACYKILNTERYRYVIYSWNYGVELEVLFGKPIPWVFAEIPRRVREALVQDDRVKDVRDFNLSHNGKGDVLAKFTVKTIYGDIPMEKGVKIK